ncbi:MAG: hydroxyphenylacetyl-CoA thioesterase PaaI [Pseudomonadota bacterium]
MTPDELAAKCADAMWSTDKASQGLGMSIQAMGEGRSELTMTVIDSMVNGHNICHGGFIFTLADSAFAFACNSHNQIAVAAGCTIDFLRPASLGDVLTANAEAVHQGQRSGIYDITVTNQHGKLMATMRGRSARTQGQLLDEADST